MPVSKQGTPVKAEVWVLFNKVNSKTLPPALDDDGTEVFLAWPTKEQAEKGLLFQIEQGYIDEGEYQVERVAPDDYWMLGEEPLKKVKKDRG